MSDKPMEKIVTNEKLYGRKTIFSKISNLVSLLSVVVIILYVVVNWENIPNMIPGHYNLAGEVDKYSSKSTIWLIIAVQVFMFIMLSLIERFPNIWNTGVKITEKNREKVYTTLRNMISYLKMIVLMYFSYMIFSTVNGLNFSGITIFGFLILVFGGMTVFVVKIFRA